MKLWCSPALWYPADTVNQPCGGIINGRVKVFHTFAATLSARPAPC